MKLTIKDLKQTLSYVEAEPSDTILSVKEKVAAEKGVEANQLKFIYSGKILKDEDTVEASKIETKGFIVCMTQKAKPAAASSSAQAAPATPAPAQQPQTPSAPAPAANPAPATANIPATPSPAPATTAAPQTTEAARSPSDPTMVMGPERQAAIANMVAMGFDEAEIQRCMRAAYYNPDRAVEYLLNGIPENLQQQAAAPAAQAQPPAQQPVATAAPTTTESATATTGAPAAEGDEPINLFEAAAAANQGNRGGATGRGAAAATGGGGPTTPGATGGGGAAAGGPAAAAAAAGGAGGNLDFLRENPTFQQLRQLVQANPQMLENVLQQVSASNPQLAQQIASNPEQFLQLLAEGNEGGDAPLPPGAQQIQVTEEERDAIERLCRLGFERDLVIQAYFACDKNEELAANFLFEHPDDEGDTTQ